MTTTAHWVAHTNSAGQPCARCTTCGSNAHPGLVGTDEDCARCVCDALPKLEPLVCPKIGAVQVIRFAR